MKINPALNDFIVPISKVKENPDNARSHVDETDIAAKVQSLKEFGQQQAILVDKNHVIVAGNGLYLAAKRLKAKHIAAWPFEGTATEAKAFGIMDNRTAEMSSWNIEAMAEVVRAMPGPERKLLTHVGFTAEELQQYLQSQPAARPAAGELQRRPKDRDQPPQDENAQNLSIVLHFTEKELAEMEKILAEVEAQAGIKDTGEKIYFLVETLAKKEGLKRAAAPRKKRSSKS